MCSSFYFIFYCFGADAMGDELTIRTYKVSILSRNSVYILCDLPFLHREMFCVLHLAWKVSIDLQCTLYSLTSLTHIASNYKYKDLMLTHSILLMFPACCYCMRLLDKFCMRWLRESMCVQQKYDSLCQFGLGTSGRSSIETNLDWIILFDIFYRKKFGERLSVVI